MKNKKLITSSAILNLTLFSLFSTSSAYGFFSSILAAPVEQCQANAASSPPECAAPDADLFRKDKWTLFTNVEFLLWTVNESALDYAIKMREPSWSSTETYAVGDY